VPATTTSTSRSRARLPSTVSFNDAVVNVSRTALLVALPPATPTSWLGPPSFHPKAT